MFIFVHKTITKLAQNAFQVTYIVNMGVAVFIRHILQIRAVVRSPPFLSFVSCAWAEDRHWNHRCWCVYRGIAGHHVPTRPADSQLCGTCKYAVGQLKVCHIGFKYTTLIFWFVLIDYNSFCALFVLSVQVLRWTSGQGLCSKWSSLHGHLWRASGREINIHFYVLSMYLF